MRSRQVTARRSRSSIAGTFLPVLAYLIRETRDRELAADLTAEVFAAVLIGAVGTVPMGRRRCRG